MTFGLLVPKLIDSRRRSGRLAGPDSSGWRPPIEATWSRRGAQPVRNAPSPDDGPGEDARVCSVASKLIVPAAKSISPKNARFERDESRVLGRQVGRCRPPPEPGCELPNSITTPSFTSMRIGAPQPILATGPIRCCPSRGGRIAAMSSRIVAAFAIGSAGNKRLVKRPSNSTSRMALVSTCG